MGSTRAYDDMAAVSWCAAALPKRSFRRLPRACGATLVCANADVTPYARRRDGAIKDLLGPGFQRWWGNLVHPPGAVVTAKGRTSRVFTPFAARWERLPLPTWPTGAPATH